MNMKNLAFYFKNKLIRSKALELYKCLKFNESLSVKELDALRLKKLKELFVHAKKNVPYYARVYKDINVDDIQCLEDWEKLPILTKDDIRAYSDELIDISSKKRRLRLVTTGGSTGAPLKVYHDKSYPLDVLGWRVLNWWGVKPYDNMAFIYRKVNTGWRLILNHLIWFPTRRIFLDASLMNEKSMLDFYLKLEKVKPKVLQGYVGAVYEFAKFCHKNNFKFDFIKAVWVTSAPLSESQRTVMQDVFCAPVYDQYGCSEIYWLAVECKEKCGLHILSDVRHVEILRSDGTNCIHDEYGEITITDLTNYAFPLIRYKNGDSGRYLNSKCICGSCLPLIDKVRGRITDVIRLKDGGVIAGDYLTTIFDDYPDAVLEFQIRQRQDFSIDVYCVLGNVGQAKLICSRVIDELSRKINFNVDIKLHFVDGIKHEQGKTRFIISDVNK